MRIKPNKEFMTQILEQFEKLENQFYNSDTLSSILQEKKIESKLEFLSGVKKQLLLIFDKIEEYEENIWIERMKNKTNNGSLKDAPEHIKKNKNVIKMSLNITVKNFSHLPESLKDDEEFIDWIYKNSKLEKVFSMISNRLKSMKKFAKVVEIDPELFQHLPKSLRGDKELIFGMFEKNTIQVSLKTNDALDLSKFSTKEEIMRLVGFHSFFFSNLGSLWRHDTEIIKAALSANGYRITEIPVKFRRNIEYLKIALSYGSPYVFSQFDREIKENYNLILEFLEVLPEIFQVLKDEFKTKKAFKIFLKHNQNENFYFNFKVPMEFKMNKYLLKYGMSYRRENINYFSPTNEVFLRGILIHLDYIFLQLLFHSPENMIEQYFNSKICNEIFQFFKGKIYLLEELFFTPEMLDFGSSSRIELNSIVVEDREKKSLLKYAMKLKRIYLALVFDQKIKRLSDLKFNYL
eukprot:gene12050-5546_t